MDDLIERAAELLATTGPTVVFTGAGVSTESGIPDFRSPTGIWARYDPDDFSFQNFVRSEEGRRRYWALGRQLYATIREAAPNPAHRAIAALDALGLFDCVITQNIDNLHQRAPTLELLATHPVDRLLVVLGSRNSSRSVCPLRRRKSVANHSWNHTSPCSATWGSG